ncbi:MAG: hypothetical protein H6750_06655 [Nitrospiraceae bacterium]|nr:hypothetical protein [Nitrospiraceae bacterium]
MRGKLVTRGKAKRADYILYYKPNIPIALIERRTTPTPSVAAYSKPWSMPRPWISHSSFHQTVMPSSSMTERDKTKNQNPKSRSTLPTRKYSGRNTASWKGLAPAQKKIVQNYYDDASGKNRATTNVSPSTKPYRSHRQRPGSAPPRGHGHRQTHTAFFFEIIWRL